MIHRLSACLQRHAAPDDVEYLHSLARMALTVTVATAAVVYITRGGTLMRLAPNA